MEEKSKVLVGEDLRKAILNLKMHFEERVKVKVLEKTSRNRMRKYENK